MENADLNFENQGVPGRNTGIWAVENADRHGKRPIKKCHREEGGARRGDLLHIWGIATSALRGLLAMTVLLKDQLAVLYDPGAQIQDGGEREIIGEGQAHHQAELVDVALLQSRQVEGLGGEGEV